MSNVPSSAKKPAARKGGGKGGKSGGEAAKMLQSARTALVIRQPFFGMLALRLALVEDPGCGTAWVDGTSLGYDPEFIEGLDHQQVVGLLAHEVMHCACGHPWRRDQRDHERWNVACDLAVNPILADAGFVLPKGVLMDRSTAGKSAEWIYSRQPAPQDEDGEGQGREGGEGGDGDGEGEGDGKGKGQKPPPEHGEVRDAPADDPDDGKADGGEGKAEQRQGEADWQVAVQQAANIAKAQGSLAGGLERFAKAAVAPRVDWKAALRRFVQQAAKSDYSWTRPNARYLAGGLYLPAMRSEDLGPIVVAIDTSGSIDQVLLNEFASEVNSIADDARPSRIVVVYCDTEVNSVREYERDEPIELAAQGGGGTDFRPVFDLVAKMDEPPACVVYLTDLMGDFPAVPPEAPTLWASVKDGAPPFGEVVVIR